MSLTGQPGWGALGAAGRMWGPLALPTGPHMEQGHLRKRGALRWGRVQSHSVLHGANMVSGALPHIAPCSLHAM